MPADPKRVQGIFLAALEAATSAERTALLAAQCGDDAELRRRVEALLAASDQSASLPRGAGQVVPDTVPPASVQRPGMLVAGRYKLLEQIGEGGMGAVWVAEQTEPLRRRVALKLIKPGMDTKQVLSRFSAERQALALMDHPHIAKVYDGGMTDEGRPFFVMEYVKGVPITDYCDQAKLPIHERLKLFVPVCQAVQHAHQKGVIHRDLKPSNILVCLYDGQPVPKVIDFGLAKAISQPLTEHTLYTAHGLMVGTPLYMSPEQAEFNNLDVDTRTDIYSLGVILYELLTGSTPLEKQTFKEAAFAEMLRLIKEVEPPKPSTKLSASAALPAIAAQRGLEAAQLSRLVRGELDWIVMKSLEKERSRRYETANGLARDLERYVNDEPVEACPPSLSYKFHKFARRHRRSLVTAALFSLMIVASLVTVAGSIGYVWSTSTARQAVVMRRANLVLDDAEAAYRQGRLGDALAALQQAEGLLASAEPQPDVLQRFRQWKSNLALVDRIEAIQLEKATALRDEHFDPAVAVESYRQAFLNAGIDLARLGPLDTAQRLRQSPIQWHLVAALDDWALLSGKPQRGNLFEIARRATPEAWRNQFRIAVEADELDSLVQLATSEASLDQPAIILQALGAELARRGQDVAALSLLRRAHRRYPNDFWINAHLGNVLLRASEADEAAVYLRLASARCPESAAAANSLGVALALSGKLPEAAEQFRAAIRLQPTFAMPRLNVAYVLDLLGQPAEAEAAIHEAVRLQPNDSGLQLALGELLLSHRKFEESEQAYRQAMNLEPDDFFQQMSFVEMLQKAGRVLAVELEWKERVRRTPQDWRLHRFLGILRRVHNPAASEQSLREALRIEPNDAIAEMVLGLVLFTAGQTANADSNMADAERHAQRAVALQPTSSWARQGLAAVLMAQQRWGDAEVHLREAIRLGKSSGSHASIVYLMLTLCLRAQGKSTSDIARPSLATMIREGAGLRARYELGTLDHSAALLYMEQAVYRSSVFSRGSKAEGFWPPTATGSRRLRDARELPLRSVLRRDPRDAKARSELLELMLTSTATTSASSDAWEGVCLDPGNAEFHVFLGRALSARLSNAAYAEGAFREAIRLNPDHVRAHEELAWNLAKQGDVEAAISAAQTAVRLEPQNARNQHVLAWCLAKQGDLAGAEAAYRKELRVRPERLFSQYDLAWVLMRQGKTEAAEAALADAKRLSRGTTSSAAYLGNAYATNGVLWNATQHLEAAGKEDPSDSGSAMRAAFLLLFQGDRSGYERIARELLERYQQTSDPVAARRTVHSCVISPEIVGELSAHVRLADYTLRTQSGSSLALRERALVAYRSGQWDDVLRWGRESRMANDNAPTGAATDNATDAAGRAFYRAQNLVVEAMALHRLERAAEARHAYEMAARIGSNIYPHAPHRLGSAWVDWIIFELLRREAAELLSIHDDSDWPRSVARARGAAAAGDWAAATSEYVRSCQSPAADSFAWMAAAVALARAGDQAGYRRHSAAMIERFRGTTDLAECERSLKVCALLPGNIAVPSDLLDAVSKPLDDGTLERTLIPWVRVARALVAVRQGRWDAAVADAQRAAYDASVLRRARIKGFLIVAIAEQGRGNTPAARMALQQADELHAQELIPKRPDGQPDERLLLLEHVASTDLLMIGLLRREAHLLIASLPAGGTPAGTDTLDSK